MIIRKETYSQQVVDYVKGALRSGELSPGAPLTEQMLAERLQISRAPIREALQILTNEGLVETYPHKGRVIKTLTPKQILDNTFIAGALEGALVLLSISEFTTAHFTRLEEIIREVAKIDEKAQGSLVKMVELNDEFHRIICENSEMSFLAEYVQNLCQNVSKLLYFRFWKKIFTSAEKAEQYRLVYEAIRSKDATRIERALKDYHCLAGQRICACLAEEEAQSAGLRSAS